MLWRKESSKENASYVDVFASVDKEYLDLNFMMTKLQNKKPLILKSNSYSLAQRQEGNTYYLKGDYNKAIEKYNDSLCLAEPYSQLIAIAYANRSICFLKLKMYDECLVDIKLAKNFNYPQDLMHKLDERETEALKGIKNAENITHEIGLKLSYGSDERFPCLANVLNVEEDGKGNFTVTAKEDIGVGKTIAVEKAFTTYSIMDNNLKCNICLKRNTNLVPCNDCTSVMFCHDKCEYNILHHGECSLAFSGENDLDAGILKEVRIILMVVDMFCNADELMDFVEKTIKHEPMNTLTTLSDAKLQYLYFLNLPFSQKGPNEEEFLTSLYYMYTLALEVPKVNKYFNTEKHRRFLMHLIGLHFQITDDNSNWSKRLFDVNGKIKNICTHGLIGLRNRFFGLSCIPNVMHSDHNDRSVFITIRPVKKGEPLLTYIADYLLLESKAKRQQVFRQRRKTACKCSRCEGVSATLAQEQQITTDPEYCNVSSVQHDTDAQLMDEKYVTFLNKHGHIPWCDAIGKVIIAYVHYLREKMSGQGFSSDVMEALKQL